MAGKSTAAKIQEVITQMSALKAVQRHYDSTLQELEEIKGNKATIETKMAKELEDINALEKLSVTSIFHKVLGDKEAQLEKERQEYLQVTLQHKEILNAIEVVEFELDILEKKLVAIDELSATLDALKAQREQEILSSPGPLRNELSLLHKKMDDVQQYKEELGEAIVMGERTYASLEVIYDHMKKAKDWGNWDMMRGRGGRYEKSLKHNAIDRAMNEVSRAKLLLKNFNKELGDIGFSQQRLALQVEHISRFPGIIFDNLISDWIVQNKIKSVLATVANLMDEVQLIMKSLIKDKTLQNDTYEDLERQKNRLLEEN